MTESKIRLEMTLSFFSISHFKAYKYEKTAILENENVTRGGGHNGQFSPKTRNEALFLKTSLKYAGLLISIVLFYLK